MFKCKFSKKCMTSIVFLLAALLISLFLGSYNFLTVNSVASLPNVLENLDNMDPAPAPMAAVDPNASPSPAASPASASAPVSTPVKGPASASTNTSPVSNDDINKILNMYGGK